MKHARLIILGIDGMDFDYVTSILNELPTIKKLASRGLITPFRSVFPPDSIPSWITCYTGLDPSEHGVLEEINYFAKGAERLTIDTSIFQGRSFWDDVGNAGKRVCVINPFMAYPVWPVNGVMINGPVFIDGNIQVSDPAWVKDIQVPHGLGGIVDFPTRKTLKKFVSKVFLDTAEQARFGMQVLKKNRPDLFFQVFLTMDRIQHFLWRYCDKHDPTYPGPNPFQNSIKDFYIYMDNVIGGFVDAAGPNDRIIVISDHGHGMRCTHCFNINEFLRKHGYVKSAADGKLFSKQLIIEKLKNSVLNFMNEHDLEDYMSKIAKLIPNAKNLKKGKHITDSRRNKAYASDFTGTNPFGGVCINRQLVFDYEQTRSDLINLLNDVREDGKPVFEWILKREEMFCGSKIDLLPDILFCLKSKYGVNWNLHTKIFNINPTHKKISGGHREYGVFFTNIPKSQFAPQKEIKMTNFFATVYDLFGLDSISSTSGKSFLRVKN